MNQSNLDFEKFAAEVKETVNESMKLVSNQKARIRKLQEEVNKLKEENKSLRSQSKAAEVKTASVVDDAFAHKIVEKLAKVSAIAPEYIEANAVSLKRDPKLAYALLDKVTDNLINEINSNQGSFVPSIKSASVVTRKSTNIPQNVLEDIQRYERQQFENL